MDSNDESCCQSRVLFSRGRRNISGLHSVIQKYDHLRYAGNIHGDFIYSFVKGEGPVSFDFNGDSLQQVIENSIDLKLEQLYKKQSVILLQSFINTYLPS